MPIKETNRNSFCTRLAQRDIRLTGYQHHPDQHDPRYEYFVVTYISNRTGVERTAQYPIMRKFIGQHVKRLDRYFFRDLPVPKLQAVDPLPPKTREDLPQFLRQESRPIEFKVDEEEFIPWTLRLHQAIVIAVVILAVGATIYFMGAK